MTAVLTSLVALFFAGMGLLALAQPARILGLFGIGSLPLAARNEVRAVYGGFGLAVAALLLATLRLPSLREGVHISIAIALVGMAAGRLVSAAVDRRFSGYPLLFLFVELGLAAMLWVARTG